MSGVAPAGVLLAVEVGYKFMFYGDDAKAAAEALSIVAYPFIAFIVSRLDRLRNMRLRTIA